MQKINLILVAFCLLVIRATALGANVGDALLFIGLVSYMAAKIHLDSKKGPDVNEELRKELDSIKAYMTAMSLKNGFKDTISQEKPREFKRMF